VPKGKCYSGSGAGTAIFYSGTHSGIPAAKGMLKVVRKKLMQVNAPLARDARAA
jgi:hypothetical protein